MIMIIQGEATECMPELHLRERVLVQLQINNLMQRSTFSFILLYIIFMDSMNHLSSWKDSYFCLFVNCLFQTLRRLAQNREAARKSRLRKKAYVQQLESSRIKLTQLEQDLQRARSQVLKINNFEKMKLFFYCFVHRNLVVFLVGGSGGANLSSGRIIPNAAIFDMEYTRWLEDDHRYMSEFWTALQAHLSNEEDASNEVETENGIEKLVEANTVDFQSHEKDTNDESNREDNDTLNEEGFFVDAKQDGETQVEPIIVEEGQMGAPEGTEQYGQSVIQEDLNDQWQLVVHEQLQEQDIFGEPEMVLQILNQRDRKMKAPGQSVDCESPKNTSWADMAEEGTEARLKEALPYSKHKPQWKLQNVAPPTTRAKAGVGTSKK
ncbi:hypothetical protein IFM89_012844 [Coptis chinensis]|uniref:BZIP domain-containing protein n=1 Tax=Coptis chinensis TaxID=261450 RepID=A0A835MCK4_9MAGN|nr:hypothetical protein IFM89_012844 [Coptis chinensis]